MAKIKLDFTTVVPAAQQGDKAAQNALMERFYGWSVLQAKQLVRDDERARDIAVEFWAQLLHEGRIAQYTVDLNVPFLTWMRVRLRSFAIDWLRAREQPQLVYEGDTAVEDTTPSDAPDPADTYAAVATHAAIRGKLTPTQRRVYNLMLRGWRSPEIAEALEVSVQHAYDTVSAVRRIARDCLTKEDEA